MRFDWVTFLRRNRIEYVTTGPNASRGHVNIKCPFCGSSDPSEHMGISVRGEGYACWRNKSHGGKSPVRLVAALLQCDPNTARAIVYEDADQLPTKEQLRDKQRTLRDRGRGEDPIERGPLKFLPEFKSIMNGSPMATPFINYLLDRGYSWAEVEWLTETYQLKYATKGRFAYRLIIPVYDRDGELLTWTGRSVRRDEELRYKALGTPKPNRDPPFAKCATKEALLGLPYLWSIDNPKVLVLVEGPFDAWRITSIGRGLGVYATCLFGLSVQLGQLDFLYDLTMRFPRIVLLLDPDANLHRLRLRGQLSGLTIETRKLEGGAEDPAELSTDETLALCIDLLGGL